LHQFS